MMNFISGSLHKNDRTYGDIRWGRCPLTSGCDERRYTRRDAPAAVQDLIMPLNQPAQWGLDKVNDFPTDRMPARTRLRDRYLIFLQLCINQ